VGWADVGNLQLYAHFFIVKLRHIFNAFDITRRLNLILKRSLMEIGSAAA
jgi:hypothetical protein